MSRSPWADRSATPIVLGLIAIVLYVPLIGWGLPYATAPDRIKTVATDEILPLEGLAEMRSTFFAAAPNRNYGYPWWHYAVVSAAQAPYLAVLWLSGDFAAPTGTYPFGLRDPVRALQVLTILGRLVSVLMGAGIVIASFLFARALWSAETGVIASVLTMVSYPMFYYSRTGNLDVPAFFWSACGLVVLATILSTGLTIRRAIWLGVFAALGVATKEQAVANFVPLGLVLLVPRFNHAHGETYRLAPLAALIGAGLAVYAAATGMLFDPQRHLRHLYFILFDPTRVSDAAQYFRLSPRTWEGTVALARDFVSGLSIMMSWPVLVLASGGLVAAVRYNRWHLIWTLPFLMTFLVLVRLPGLLVIRYLLPLTLIVDAFAAFALIEIGRSRRWLMAIAFTIAVGWRVAIAVDLSYAQLRDTRYAAAEWLRSHYHAGDRIEYFGGIDKLPAMEAEMMSRRVMGREDYTNEAGNAQVLLDYFATAGPQYVIVIPDWTSQGAEHGGDCPPEVFQALMNGTTGYKLAASFTTPSILPAPIKRPALDYPVVAPPVRIFERR